MGIWPDYALEPNITITPWTSEAIGTDLHAAGNIILSGAAGATWPLANLAIFVPFTLITPITVLKCFVYNGATVSSGWDVGVYTSDGTRIFSTASTTQSTASVIQSGSVTTSTITTIGPGDFYMAMSANSSTSTYFRGVFSLIEGMGQMCGMACMTTAFPLPVTATLGSATTATGYIPVFGITTRSVV